MWIDDEEVGDDEEGTQNVIDAKRGRMFQNWKVNESNGQKRRIYPVIKVDTTPNNEDRNCV